MSKEKLAERRFSADERERWEDFTGWIRELGWNGAETARQLKIKPGYVSELMNGKKSPSETLVAFLKALVGNLRPDLLKSGANKGGRMIGLSDSAGGLEPLKEDGAKSDAKKLEEIKAEDAKTYAAIKHLIDVSHDKTKKKVGH